MKVYRSKKFEHLIYNDILNIIFLKVTAAVAGYLHILGRCSFLWYRQSRTVTYAGQVFMEKATLTEKAIHCTHVFFLFEKEKPLITKMVYYNYCTVYYDRYKVGSLRAVLIWYTLVWFSAQTVSQICIQYIHFLPVL